MQPASRLRTPLKRARGLGPAHSGTHHFWVLRVSAVALIPLSIWFLAEVLSSLLGADRAGVSAWLQHPLTALALALFIVATLVHARLGVHEIIADYIPHAGKKIALVLLTNAVIYGFGAASLVAIAKLHFFGI